MFKKTLMLVGALALMLVAVRAHAGNWTIGLIGGLASPRGDFAATLGLIGGVDLDYLATPHLALGVDGSFVRFGKFELPIEAAGTPITMKSTMLQGGAHLKYIVRQTRVSPFVSVGLGAYKLKEASESPDPFYDSDGGYQTYFGTRAGLGLVCRVSDSVAISVESAIHGAWTDFSWASGFAAHEFISVQTGVSMGIGNPAH